MLKVASALLIGNKWFPRQIQSRQGFTLVELMVVVSIVGVLAAIAVPNFQIQQARSRTSEAKLNLASLYSAEQSVAIEQGSYSLCLLDIGFTPVTEYYTVGFGGPAQTTCGPRSAPWQYCYHTFAGGIAVVCSVAPANYMSYPATKASGGSIPTLNNQSGLFGDRFQAQAIGKISGRVSGNDEWRINELRSITNPAQGY